MVFEMRLFKMCEVDGHENKCGGIAQLGERLNGIQEVSGSIPLTSTIYFSPFIFIGPIASGINFFMP